jgi:hypothetical protein
LGVAVPPAFTAVTVEVKEVPALMKTEPVAVAAPGLAKLSLVRLTVRDGEAVRLDHEAVAAPVMVVDDARRCRAGCCIARTAGCPYVGIVQGERGDSVGAEQSDLVV